jgi:hypothetical protein
MDKSKFADNEGKCCDAVLRVLEKRVGEKRSNMFFPERQQHSAPVELVCMIGPAQYAVEHTKLEPYERQMQDSVFFINALGSLEKSVIGLLPKDAFFRLTMQPGAFDGLTKRQVDTVREKIEQWIISIAPSLKPTRYRTDIRRNVIDRMEVALYATIPLGALGGVLRIARYEPPNLEGLRRKNLQRSLEKKLPKLQHWSRDGFSTVLVLESEDIALTNHQLVLDALRRCLPNRFTCPTHIFFVEASTPTWYVITLVRDGQFPAPDFGWWDCQEFEVNSLVNVMEDG